MSALRARFVASLAVAAGLISSSPAKAQDAGVTLQYKFAKNDRWSIDEELTVKMVITLTAKGKETRTISQTNHRVRKGDLTVVKATDGRLESVRVRFGAECLDTEQPEGGELVRKPTALAGQEVTVRRKDGSEASVKAAAVLSDTEKAEARALLDPTDALFPKTTVKVGDRWVVDEHALPAPLVKLFAMTPGAVCKVRLCLKEIVEVGGRRVAGIEAKVAIDQKGDGSTSKIDLAGTFALDIESGIALAVELRGTRVASGEIEQADENGKAVKVLVEAKGDIQYRSGLNTFPAGATTAPVTPGTGAASFGHMRWVVPEGWKSVAYSNGVLLQPTYLPAGHLDMTIMQAVDAAGTLDETLKQSWDDAAKQLGLAETMTVDGTPYVKRERGTSFKGWEYLLADGSLRATEGDFFVKLFLVKLKDRVERIVVVSKERSYRGDVSCAQAGVYLDLILEFFFAVQFDDWKDPVLEPATLKGDGIVGVWAGISMTNGALGSDYTIFFSNGQAYHAGQFPVHGLDNFNTRIDAEMRKSYWGAWTYKDGKGVLKMPGYEIPLRMVGEQLGCTSHRAEHMYIRLSMPDGARFDGTWEVPQEIHDRPVSGITFTAGGEFKDYGAVNCLNHGYPLTEAPGEGTYEVRNYALVLRFKDGREYRIAFPGLEYEKGNLRPDRLTLSFNDNTLNRK